MITDLQKYKKIKELSWKFILDCERGGQLLYSAEQTHKDHMRYIIDNDLLDKQYNIWKNRNVVKLRA